MGAGKPKKRKLDLSSIQLAPDPKIRKVHIEEISTSSTKITAKELPRVPTVPLPPLLAQSTPPDLVNDTSGDPEEKADKKTVVCNTIPDRLLNTNINGHARTGSC